ncbi:MAG: hypothetical protein KGY39_02440 [Anaerolineales bacterium]|nr:hypothetical protein [Anaerolineales bacterium]MBS3752378.1 hypothetical protein [Anaerolineales bacterium]
MNNKPISTSKSTNKSIWQEYLIYNDRIEFNTLFGKMTVPFDHIERVNVAESDLKRLLTRCDLQLKNFRPALKLDWANFLEHVVLDKSEGKIRRILFTPDDPEAFIRALEKALSGYRSRQAKKNV